MTLSLNRTQRKAGLYIFASACVSTMALLIGRAFPGHQVLIMLSLTMLFSGVVVPMWPKQWSYAPEVSYDSIYERWRDGLPKPVRIAIRSVVLIGGCFCLWLFGYLIYTECIRPLF